jgi:hypothetical protein
MDFDHVRGEKSVNLSRLRNSRLAWSRLVAELEKCEVVCATRQFDPDRRWNF